METKTQNLKELYEKDFYLWVQENLKLLKNREYGLVDWENMLEEIESMGRSELRSVISHVSRIMEHLYKWENFRYAQDVGHSWIDSIDKSRRELESSFMDSPSLRAKSQERESLQKAWRLTVSELVRWFKKPINHNLTEKYFGRFPTERDFPKECPYTFEQIMEYEPWAEKK
jgi:hypothetical protein